MVAFNNIQKNLLGLLGGSERFQSNFKKIASANALAQIIGVAFLPVLSRLFSPEDFSVLTTYTLAQSIILSFATGRAEWIVPNSKSRKQVTRLMGLGVIIAALVLFGLAIFIVLFHQQLAQTLELPQTSKVLWLLPVGVMAGSIQLLWQSLYIFGGNLGRIGLSKLAQALITIGLSLVFGLSSLGGDSLVFAYIIGFASAAGILLSGSSERDWKKFWLERRVALKVFKTYGHQLMSSTALSVVNVCMTMSLTLLLIAFYTPQTVGWYGLVFRIATAPIGLFTTAIVQSFWSDAAQLTKTDPVTLRSFYKGSVIRLSILAIPFALVFLCGPLYVPIIFGREEWSGAGYLLMAVTPYLVGMIIFSPTTHLIVYGKAHWQLVCDLITFAIAVVSFALVAKAGYEAWVAIGLASSVLLGGYLVRFALHLRANTIQIAKLSNKISAQVTNNVEKEGGSHDS